MGPVMNLLLAVSSSRSSCTRAPRCRRYQDQPPVVGAWPPDRRPPRAGIQPGDRILSVAGRDVDTWEQLYIAIGTRPNREVSIVLQRDGREIERTMTPVGRAGQSRFEIGDIGVLPNVHPHLRSVSPGEPAETRGLEGGRRHPRRRRPADHVPLAVPRGDRQASRAADDGHGAARRRRADASP